MQLAPLFRRDYRITACAYFRVAGIAVEVLHILDGIGGLPYSQRAFHDFIQIDEDIVPQQLIHFLLAEAVTAHEASTGGNLIGRIMVDMHGRVLLPPLIDPSDEFPERVSLLIGVVGPKVPKRAPAVSLKIGAAP